MMSYLSTEKWSRGMRKTWKLKTDIIVYDHPPSCTSHVLVLLYSLRFVHIRLFVLEWNGARWVMHDITLRGRTCFLSWMSTCQGVFTEETGTVWQQHVKILNWKSCQCEKRATHARSLVTFRWKLMSWLLTNINRGMTNAFKTTLWEVHQVEDITQRLL